MREFEIDEYEIRDRQVSERIDKNSIKEEKSRLKERNDEGVQTEEVIVVRKNDGSNVGKKLDDLIRMKGEQKDCRELGYI